MAIVYIAGKYTGNIDENIALARDAALKIWEAGHFAMCPHLNTAHFNDDLELTSKDYVDRDLQMLARCDAILMLPGWQESHGANQELEFAIACDIPVYHFPDIPPLSGDRGYVRGMGTDAPTTINEQGGKQSKLDYRFDLIDPLPLFKLAEILSSGADKYGKWNWRRISVEDNLNHALSHIFAYLAGDRQDDHLGHAFCRLMFAISVDMTPGEVERMKFEE